MAVPKGPFTAFAGFEIRAENTTVDDWMDIWRVRADDARDFEPMTSAYAGTRSLDPETPNQILVFERYTGGSKAIKDHSARPAHIMMTDYMLKKKVTKRQTISGMLGEEIFGWTRTDRKKPDTGNILSCNVFRFGSEAQRDQFVALASEHAKYCWENEPDTLTYYGGLIVDKVAKGPAVQKGDLFFVAEYTDQAAREKHRDDPKHVALGKTLDEKGIQRDRIWESAFQNTGRGFMMKPGMAQAKL